MTASIRNYWTVCKPRVVMLMLLTTWAGMYLAVNHSLPLSLWVFTTMGVAFMSGSAATFNHIIDRHIDAIMERTKNRPLASGNMNPFAAWTFAGVLGTLGFVILLKEVNTLTAVLTLFASIGYAIIYTMYLKRATSQNIVIGGLAGAMPPLLGWTAATGDTSMEGWLLVLIIFSWTPAHFWAHCIYRFDEYKQSGFPMLPVTHGIPFTKLNIVLYTLLTAVTTLLPYGVGMSGNLYLVTAIILNTIFLAYALKLKFTEHNPRLALSMFKFSIIYLMLLFIAMLFDHHLLLG